MLASSETSSSLVRFLEAIGVDASQISKDGVLQLEWVNRPTYSVVLLVVLLVGAAIVWFSRKQLDEWSAMRKVALIVGSVIAFCGLTWLLIALKAGLSGENLRAAAKDPSLMFAAIAGGAFWVPWLYRWETKTCSLGSRLGLAVVRVAVLVVLVLIWLDPEIVPEVTKTVQRTIILLRDKSQSMAFEDAWRSDDQAKSTASALGTDTDDLRENKRTRAKVLDQVLAMDDHKFIRELQQRGKLLVIDFDDTLTKPIDPVVNVSNEKIAVTNVVNTQPAEDTSPARSGLQTLALGIFVGLVVLFALISLATSIWTWQPLRIALFFFGYFGIGIVVLFAALFIKEGMDRANRSSDESADIVKAKEDVKKKEIKLAPINPDGRGSDIYTAIHEPLSSRSPAALVLFTDGQHTAKEDPRAAAQEALNQGVKLYIVGVGDPSRPKNIRIDGVYAQPNVGTKDKFDIETSLQAEDIPPQQIKLELIEQKVASDGKTLGPEKIVATEGQMLDKPKITGIKFQHEQSEPGKYVYSVRVAPFDDEVDVDDNRASSSPVTVLQKENRKVLLVSGAPSWEYRLVQKLLTRDDTIKLSCWLQTLDEDRAQDGDPDARIRELPRRLTAERDIPGLNDYDVVLMFDPNPNEFDQEWVETLKKYVSEHAGGLLYMAGPKYTGSFLSNPRTSAIRDVLPVRFGDVAAVEVQTLMSSTNRAYPLRVVMANADHGLLQFKDLDTAGSQRRWESLPGIFWSFPATGPKPTAQVLLEHSDTTLRNSEGARPLLVTGRYGAGNTAYIGFNGTWRWRQMGREAEFFDNFWINVVNALSDGRSSQGRRYGSLATNKDRYEVGEKIQITARLRDASYDDLVVDQVDATLKTEQGSPISITLKPVAGQKGAYEGFATARQTGVHTLSVSIPASQGVQPTVDDKNFSVELPRVEMNQQWLNKPDMVTLAQMTGGDYFELNQLDKLAAAIPNQTEKITERGAPKPLWDVDLFGFLSFRSLLLGLLVGLLSFEWAIRKALKLL